jgi:hypothetical protein
MAIFIVNAGFNALLGGDCDLDGRYSRRNAHGFYWAATENDSSYCLVLQFRERFTRDLSTTGGRKNAGIFCSLREEY